MLITGNIDGIDFVLHNTVMSNKFYFSEYDVNKEDFLKLAVIKSNTEMVYYLLNQGCNPRSYQYMAIRFACSCGNLEILDALLSYPYY
jgi:hypothetical protein